VKLLSYAGATYSTGTAIADAVLAYSVALARRQLTELVKLPFVAASGETLHLEIPIGWMREIAGISQPAGDSELEDVETVEGLTERTRALEPARPSLDGESDAPTHEPSILWSDFDPTELEY
jgi:hypothetical protein